MIDALWDALPKEYQGGFWYDKKEKKWKPKANTVERAKLVYAHFGKIDLKKAMTNIAKNQLEDKLIGKANQYINKSAKPYLDMMERPVGLGFRGWRGFG